MNNYLNDKPRVVVLMGSDSQHRNTLASLIANNINVVGVCISNSKDARFKIKYLIKSINNRGLFYVCSQILARILYLIRNKLRDDRLKSQIFDDAKNRRIIDQMSIPTSISENYSLQKDFISHLEPDILIVHTQSWVGKDVRELEGVKYVIGGHPGITPIYRGSHSPFWAIYNSDARNIGWTCFLVDQGVDTGPVIEQGFILPSSDDTYMSLSWKCMVEIALSQVRAINNYHKHGSISNTPHKFIPKKSEYFPPTLIQQIKYWLIQQKVK